MAVVAWASLVLVVFAASSVEALFPEIMHILPQPRSYSMQMKEIYDCVSCNEDEKVQDEFTNCLTSLPAEIRKDWNSCCRRTFSDEFCKEVSQDDKIDYATICKKPKKAIEVERCTRRKVGSLNPYILEFSQCKRKILTDHCTTSSSEERK